MAESEMDPRTVYEIWAPPDGTWSPWAKPVLFAHLSPWGDLPMVEIPSLPLPDELLTDGLAVVVDLPGLESLGVGLELASAGYRPVPLYNACPAPVGLDDEVPREVVPVTPLLSALIQGAKRLQAAGVPVDAPPAFLLDTSRRGADKPIAPGWFDNRWVVFSTDLPSADVLSSQQIAAVQVIHRGPLQADLVDVLRDWTRKGILLTHVDLEKSGASESLIVPPGWRLGLAQFARRFWALLNLRRAPGGGYGGFVPEYASSG